MRNDNYVVVAGTFDLFHHGHKELLWRASQLGKVIALVNTDRFVQEFKNITPTQTQYERWEDVFKYKYVDLAFLNDSSDLTDKLNLIIETYKVVGVVFGDDYDIESYRKQTGITREWQQKHDIALIQFPRTDGISSTLLREKLADK